LGYSFIDLQNKRVEIYRPGQAVKVLQNPDTLSGEEFLPEFTLSLKRIFSV
jgi:Uma2 family endonuclease